MSMSPTDSLSGKIVTLLGGAGFLGKHLAQELLSRGARVRIASRHPEKGFMIKALGELGTVQFGRCDVTRPESLAAALAGSDAVVNLVGAFTGKLEAIQGEGVGAIAAAAKAAGASAFVHVSAIGADASSALPYARTKAEGEAAALAAFPTATIVRPSIMFGADDAFLMMFGKLIASAPIVPVFAPEAPLQPVFVDDVAEAITNAAGNPATFGGKTFELAGPEVITMRALLDRIAAAEGRKACIHNLSDGLASLIAALPGTPISSQQYKLLKAGNVASGAAPGLADLGVAPRPMGLYLERWMTQFRNHGRFGSKLSSAS